MNPCREAVAQANWALPRAGLVTMHSGNASGLDGETLYIKPSGMDYDAITPENLVAVDLKTGLPHEGQFKPIFPTTCTSIGIFQGLVASSTRTVTTPPPLRRAALRFPAPSRPSPTSLVARFLARLTSTTRETTSEKRS